MKKWLLAAAAVLILSYGDFLPFENADAGDLYIVETLFVEKKGNRLVLLAEDIQGSGADVAAAAEDMKKTAPGRLFLRQVKRIVFCQGAQTQVDILSMPEEIPLGASVFVSNEPANKLLNDLENLEKRLEVQEEQAKNMITLAQLQNGALKEAGREDQ